MYAGVYLSQNGVFIEHDSSILITDIGTSSPHQLVCNTDKRSCCKTLPARFGNWFFPNNTAVVSSGNIPSPTEFYRDRNDNGEINLYRVSGDVMSPTGRFCCEVEDATATNQTVCVNIGMSCRLCAIHYNSNINIPLSLQFPSLYRSLVV